MKDLGESCMLWAQHPDKVGTGAAPLRGALSNASTCHHLDSISTLFDCSTAHNTRQQLRNRSGTAENRAGAREAENSGNYGVHQPGSHAIPTAGGGCVENAQARANGV